MEPHKKRLRMRFTLRNNLHKDSQGFTLIEMLIIAPVVLIVIGTFVTLMVSMVGTVLITRDRNVLTYNVHDALDRIEQDTRISTQFLTTTGTLTSPQGSGDTTTPFTDTSTLLLSSLTTDKNPNNSTRQLVYYAQQPNACGTSETYNRIFLNQIIYYVKNGSLWRRNVLPTYNLNATPDSNTVCEAPWQRNTCTLGYSTIPPCETNDEEIMQNVSSFSVKYYADPSSITDLTASGANGASTIEVTINGTKTTAGKSLNSSGTVRATKLNSINATLQPPASPTPTYVLSAPASATFSWVSIANANTYNISYNINGGATVNTTTNSTTTSFTVNANRNDTITFNVAAVNAAGTSPNGTVTATMPSYTTCNLQNGWTNYGGAYAGASFTRTSAGVVMLHGLIQGGTAVQFEVLCTLPPGYRPDYRIIFQTSTYGTTVGRIDIDTNGNVIYMLGSSTWLNLDTISFLPSGAYSWSAGLTGYNGWGYYGDVYSPVKVTKDSLGRAFIEGLAARGATGNGTPAFGLPGGYAPPATDIYGARGDGFNAMEITPSSYVNTRGLPYNGYWSLQSMWWPSPSSGWTAPALQNGWVPFSSGYANAEYKKGADGIVNLHGLIKSGTVANGTVIASLPVGYRPKYDIICEETTYDPANSSGYARIDVTSAGNIVTREGVNNGWVSLAGCDYIAEQ
jgi:type II secretory pathway pseudopilin PulG